MANPLRNAMVYLGLAEEQDEYQQEVRESRPSAHESAPQHQAAAPQRAQVTPIRRAQPQRNAGHPEMNEILTVHPKQYRDAQVIAENFRDGVPVIMNLSEMDEAEARRLIDFASGLSQGLYGKIERVTSRVFLLSPQHIAVHGESSKLEAEKEASFFQ